MVALEVSSMKNFMNQLLTGDAFDTFLLEEAVIKTANTYTIDGRVNRDFFPMEEQTAECLPYEFRPWSEIKGLCFDLIKGKRTPLYFKFVLQLKPEKAAALLQSDGSRQSGGDLSQVKALVLTIRYDGGKAVLTTGASYRTFVPGREAEAIWDGALRAYLADKGVAYEPLISSSLA